MMIRIVAAAFTTALLGAGLVEAQTEPIHSESVVYENGEIMLAAELLIPRAAKPMPGAVIIQGSGTSSRANRWSRDIAETLVRNGIAVLLTDKRGSGASGGNWKIAGFTELAEDALAGLRYLQGRVEIDRARVGLVGLSQGGWIVPLAAAQASSDVAFVVNVSGAAVGFAEQSFLEMANTARGAGLSDSLVGEVIRLNTATARYITTGDWGQYSRTRDSVLATGARAIADGYPASPDLPIWEFLRKVGNFDPMPYWIQVSQPVFVVYGAEDEKDNVPVSESVRRLEHAFQAARKTNHRILVVSGAGHAIWPAGTGVLAAEFLDGLRDWLREHVL